jgi:hypothetical protein
LTTGELGKVADAAIPHLGFITVVAVAPPEVPLSPSEFGRMHAATSADPPTEPVSIATPNSVVTAQSIAATMSNAKSLIALMSSPT